MKNEEENIDKLIKETLNSEEAQFYDSLEEQNLIGKLIGVSKGRMGWLVVLMSVMHLVVLGFMIYCIVQFYNAEETKELLKWMSGGILAMFMMVMLKLYVWMQMDKNDILREIKRIELQIAAMTSRKD